MTVQNTCIEAENAVTGVRLLSLELSNLYETCPTETRLCLIDMDEEIAPEVQFDGNIVDVNAIETIQRCGVRSRGRDGGSRYTIRP